MKRKQSITAGCTKEVSGILKGLNEVVDDSRVVVETLLGAVGEVVDGHVMRKKVVSWFDEKGVGEEEDKKFSDGIANASEATPEMLSTVSFYNGSYVPSISGIDLCDSVGTWFLPTRVLWKPETITDLKGNCKMMLDHHNYGMPSLVVPFVLYSASQKGQRYVWSVWIVPRDPEQPGKWKSVKSAELEEAFSTSGGTFELDPAWFPKKLGLHSKHVPDDPITFTEVEEASHAEGFSLHAHFASRFVLVRYALKQRGAPLWSPVHDTISWLPTPNLDTNTFTTSMNTILPPGVIEYLYSREPSQPITWPGWEASYALGLPAAALVSKCFAEPNQQDYNKSLHEEVLALVDSIVDDNKEQRENIGNMLASWALNNNATIDVPHVDEELVRPMLRQIVGAKLGREEKPPPAMLAHCLEVQKVQWNGSIYLVALSGSNPLVTSTDGNVSVVSRMADLYDDQIFWQLNRAMRMKQFGVEPHLQVSAPDMKGNYYLKADVPNTIEECEGLAFQHDGGARLSLQQGSWTGCTHNKLHSRFVWFESGTWLLKQMLPLQYHIDKALKEAGTLKGSKAPPGLTTYRGLKDVALDRSIYDTGKVVLWGAYSSTSGDRGIAAAFAQTDGKAAVFSLTGKNCVCISKWSRFGREREWLYPPNSAFQVTSSLSEEHAELAGKKDLQIFSMNEVDEVDALIVYLRGLVNKVVTQANNAADEAKKMPRHVEQLFKVMLGLVKYKNTKEDIDLNTALAAVCEYVVTLAHSTPQP